ncbi:MAG: YebC/PmpR family DNA-binding transcriptional regulator [Planctomycetes bacterium]|nr:YebC/PmpR family DNA-binding transcriptional regulator [Planctomycetota bacterium]
MAGHSHSSNIAARKGAVDKKRAKNFTKFSRAIMSAVRQSGPDVDSNLKLKYAVEKARAGNMPKDTIAHAIKRAAGEKIGDAYEDLVYEGYAAGGIALMVVCLTDNRHRTAPDVKFIFDRNGGNLGAPGSVAFLFSFLTIVVAEREEKTDDEWLELALECGATDVKIEGTLVTITAPATEFLAVKSALEAKEIKMHSAEMGYMPNLAVPVADKEDARKVLKLIEALDENEDVQSVYANYEMPDEWIEELSGA